MDKKTIKIRDKLVEVKNGKIKATTEEIRHPDGHIDVVIHVPCLQIVAKKGVQYADLQPI